MPLTDFSPSLSSQRLSLVRWPRIKRYQRTQESHWNHVYEQTTSHCFRENTHTASIQVHNGSLSATSQNTKQNFTFNLTFLNFVLNSTPPWRRRDDQNFSSTETTNVWYMKTKIIQSQSLSDCLDIKCHHFLIWACFYHIWVKLSQNYPVNSRVTVPYSLWGHSDP